MLDFVMISTRQGRKGSIEIYPKFLIKKSSDLMIRGGDFYAIWVEDRGLWSTDEQDALRLIDSELDRYLEEHKSSYEVPAHVLHMWDAESGMIDKWHKYCQKQMRDSFHMLDEDVIFSNASTSREDYASKKLSYPLEDCDISAYDKLISTLYSPEERKKIEWAIGSIVNGDSKKIQKFLVFYGAAGTGKSTILNIIQQLFDGYYSVFDAKALGSSNNAFALESFKTNPLVAIQHDGDLSHIEDNTRLNSLVSHEQMTVNEKFRSAYTNSFKSFLFMGTNKPVRITDGKSGLLRRLIDVSPTGDKLGIKEYRSLMKEISFELGGIAKHCLDIYESDPSFYDDYIPTSMMGASNDFYNFVEDSYFVFKRDNGVSLKSAWEMYKTYCDEAKISFPFSQRIFKEELKNYFKEYCERYTTEDGNRIRSYYKIFKTSLFDGEPEKKPEGDYSWIDLHDSEHSLFDEEFKDCLAQYANKSGTPTKKWENVKTTVQDISTTELHYVKLPEWLIVIDFDIPGEDGEKDLAKNLKLASEWPRTYAELSKSGCGVHLHYRYSGDVEKLSRLFAEHIEIKVFTGNSSLRRKLTKCNDIPIATISSGLPLKEEKKVVNFDGVKSEKSLRKLIEGNLRKEYCPGTKPSMDFIKKILDDAYDSGLKYDISDMKSSIIYFASQSTHQSDYCLKLISSLKFKSDEPSESNDIPDDDRIVFYDVEVFPNLFLVNWKFEGEPNTVIRLINPTPNDIELLLRKKLVGFNCRRYDNHIMYARLLGYSNEELYRLSTRIIAGDRNAFFGEAYNISYTDVYDFASAGNKMSLKKFEIELGIHHQELGLPWDKPVDESLWETVAEYCDNDVLATEAVFNHLKGDWTARLILADLAGMTPNDTTNSLTTRIIFGKEKHPDLVYTDLSETFPGYSYVEHGEDGRSHNMYRGDDLGFGGWVYAKPGMYTKVALLDVASLHPHSAIALNYFGSYTKNFEDLVNARIHIKHKEYDKVAEMFGGKLKRYLDDPAQAKQLSTALKTAINSVYGLTSASFDNPFRDRRNVNNIVALRGALFMRTLQDEVESRGYSVVHIKTDSIKIVNADKNIIDFCMDFAKDYGYEFEHEATYDKMCLVNDAVYIARYSAADDCKGKYGYIPEKNEAHGLEWAATGAQFAVPFVFKTLFSKEDILFKDLCETKSVSSALYLDMNERLPDVSALEKQLDILRKDKNRDKDKERQLMDDISKGHDYQFIGKIGSFCPIQPGRGGGLLVRQSIDKLGNEKYDSATGAKGYRWLESEMVEKAGKQHDIDMEYFRSLSDAAIDSISEYGDYEWFVSDDIPPWLLPCGRSTCYKCPNLIEDRMHTDCDRGYDISEYLAQDNYINTTFDKR